MTEEMIPPPEDRPKPSGKDRRVWVRYPSSLEIFCQPGPGRLDHFWWLAKVHDISASGICLTLSRGFEPGTVLSVDLQSTTQNFSCTVSARVVHATAQPGGGWVVGCAFANELREDEVRALL